MKCKMAFFSSIFFMTLLFMSFMTFAQTKKIRGIVTDENNNPLSGVSVKIQESIKGTFTDSSGNFTLEDPTSAALVFSYIGYADTIIKPTGNTLLKVILRSQNNGLKTVTLVSIGYGTLDKKEVTSAITHVDAKDMLIGANNDPLMGLQGKVAGLTIQNTGSANPNSSATLQLRGVSSMGAGTTPLYIIDGVPGNIDNINQDAIVSVDVLKGGAASAIYGTRGSNGVVLITTKSGTLNSSTMYDVNAFWNFPTNQLQVLSKADYLAKIPNAVDFGSNTDWLKAVTRQPSFGQKHTLQFSGGSAKDNFFATIDYGDAQGLDLRATKQQYGGRLSFNHTSGNGFFNVKLNIAPRIANTNTNGGGFGAALVLNPTLPIYDSTGGYAFFNGAFAYNNPVEAAKVILNKQQIKELDMNAAVTLNILKNLNTTVTIGQTNFDMKTLGFTPSTLTTVQVVNSGNGRNVASQKQENTTQKTLEWVGNYSLNIHKHSFKALAGYSYYNNNYQEFDANNEGMPFDAFQWNNLGSGLYNQELGVTGMGSTQKSNTLIAFFGRVIYDYGKKYFLTASLRHEGSTRFGTNNKWGDFPAVSAAWNVSDESFMRGTSKWLNYLKFRADYGVTGNQDFDDYTSLQTYGGYGYYPYDGTYLQDYGPSQNVNPYLQWEKGINFNVGLDFGLLNNRVSGSLNYYTRKNKNLLYKVSVPIPPNAQSNTEVNLGTMVNSGIEISINAALVRCKNFSWDLSFNGNTNSNKLTSFSNQLYSGVPYLNGPGMPAPGSPGYLQRDSENVRIGEFYTLKSAGVDSTGALQVYNAAGEIIPANKASNSDKRNVGNGLPKFMASLGNDFKYKNWDLSIALRGAFGYKIFNVNAFYLGTPAQQNGAANLLTSAFDKKSRYSKLTNPKTVAILSDYFLEPGDFVKIDNVSLGYTKRFSSNFHAFRSIRVYATARNLHTFTKYTGGDPDAVPTTGLWPGTNYGIGYYPAALQLLFGLQIHF